MIGFFVFDDTPTLENPLCLAHSALNEGIKGVFYVRSMDSKDVSGVKEGAEFFGVLDDSSGFGACLFVKDIQMESDTLLLQNSIHVKKDATIDGNLKVKGQVSGKSPVTKISITADDLALLASQITSMPGPMGAVTLNHVNLQMENG